MMTSLQQIRLSSNRKRRRSALGTQTPDQNQGLPAPASSSTLRGMLSETVDSKSFLREGLAGCTCVASFTHEELIFAIQL